MATTHGDGKKRTATTESLRKRIAALEKKNKEMAALIRRLRAAVALQRRQARQKHQRALADMAKFPGENPNPVFRVTPDNKILYANPAGEALLDMWGASTLADLSGEISAAWSSRRVNEAEIGAGDCLYSISVVPVAAAGYINLYGRDITARKAAEDEMERLAARLRRERDLLTAVKESTQAQIAYLDRDFNFVDVNSAYVRGCGHTREELIGRNHFALYPNEDNERAFARVRDTGMPTEFKAKPFEFADRPEWGITYWDWTLRPVKDSSGAVEGLVLSLIDVTPHIRLERALRESEERLRTVLENSRDGINMLDLKTGRYVFISPAQAKLTGFTIEEINNISAEEVYDRVHPDDREISITQQKLVAAGDDPGSTVEYRWKVKGGEYRWFSDSRKLVRDAQGNPMALVGVSRDITERKEAEVALRKLNEELEDRVRQRTVEVLAERQRLYDVLETLPVYVALLDADYRVPFANRFFRERFGESKGRRCYEYLFGRAEPCEICDTYKVMETKSPHRWEWLGPDGRNYEIYDFPFYEADGSLQILEMGMDITESKKAKEALKTERDSLEARVAERTEELQKINEALRMRTSALMVSNKELEAFSYSVSHDLRAPLRVLDGFSLALAEDYCNSLDERAGDYIHRIRAASHRMANLIDDLLSLSRVARAEMAPRRVDLSEYARGILRDFREANAARDVEIEIGQGVFADGDPRLLKILLQNLLANAWKFSSKRAPARIEFGKIVQDGVDVFFVRDNGAGFDSKYADKLFVPFQRLHSATEFEGSGIGLAIVQRIVNRHGGRTWAEGEPDKGSTFYFTLNVN